MAAVGCAALVTTIPMPVVFLATTLVHTAKMVTTIATPIAALVTTIAMPIVFLEMTLVHTAEIAPTLVPTTMATHL